MKSGSVFVLPALRSAARHGSLRAPVCTHWLLDVAPDGAIAVAWQNGVGDVMLAASGTASRPAAATRVARRVTDVAVAAGSGGGATLLSV